MQKENTVFRTEKKYLISTVKKYTLMNKISYIASCDDNGGYTGYPVRSLYFDSIYDDDLMDKLDGLENRKKIRLRIYDPSSDMLKLELKQKQADAQLKESLWISKDLASEMIKGNYSGLNRLDSDLAMRFYTIMETGLYRPKCIIEYHRVAYMDITNNIRITFDSQIRASRNVDGFFDKDIMYVPVLDDVLEVKYNHFLLQQYVDALDIADSTAISVSKYAMSRGIIG